ncbi:hypothetical protein GDO81_001689 [Engystomops pustulosus]|uniref:Uncharacterized protein n=1 Tax=Engystomops pustulosus TaxID=76066 RepID=A0AAV7DER2_ENGPU|nr:hypothetical protein GDO81_001689 [Engystomops pustulosus]
MLSKWEGGINLPNIRGYNLACLFRHVVDWINGTAKYSNTNLERELVAPNDVVTLLHTSFSKRPLIARQSLVRDTLVAWKEEPSTSIQKFPALGQFLGRLCWNPFVVGHEDTQKMLICCLCCLTSSEPQSAIDRKANSWVKSFSSIGIRSATTCLLDSRCGWGLKMAHSDLLCGDDLQLSRSVDSGGVECRGVRRGDR